MKDSSAESPTPSAFGRELEIFPSRRYPRTKRAHGLLKLTASIVFGVVLGFGATELGIRLLLPHPFSVNPIVPDRLVGFVTKRNAASRYTNRFGEFDVLVQTNEEGFRDSSHALTKPSDILRIAFLGDSFTEAMQVRENETAIRRFESSMNSRKEHPKVECMNFGIDGYDTQQELLCYEHYVRKYKPDWVVLMVYVHNDFSGNLDWIRDSHLGSPHFIERDGKLEKVEGDWNLMQCNYEEAKRQDAWHWYRMFHVYNLSYDFFHYVSERIQVLRTAKGLQSGTPNPNSEDFWTKTAYGRYHYYVQPKDAYVDQVDTVTRLLMQKLKADVENDGAMFFVALLPAKENLWPEQWPILVKKYPGLEQFKFDFNRPFDQTREFLPDLASSGRLLDVRPILRKVDSKPLYFRHDFHFNANGNEAVASALDQWLLPSISKQGGTR